MDVNVDDIGTIEIVEAEPHTEPSAEPSPADAKRKRAERKTAEKAEAKGTTSAPKSKRRPRLKTPTSEPSPEAVDSLYNLACTAVGIAEIFAPERYRTNENDRELIVRPLSRIYLRRRPNLPAISPDAQDWFTVCIGVLGYTYHAATGARNANFERGARNAGANAFGHRPGDTTATRDSTSTAPRASADTIPAHSNGDGPGAYAENIMAGLEERIREAANARESSDGA